MDVDKGMEVLAAWLGDLPASDPACLRLCVEQIVAAVDNPCRHTAD